METINLALTLWQSAVVLSLLVVIAGVLRPKWFLFWIEEPKPFYMFALGSLLFMGSYFGYSLKVGSPLPIAALHAGILFAILLFVLGLINPSWVFGTPKLDRLWVMAIALALFMGFMTLQGMYYGPKAKRVHPLPSEAQPTPPAQSQ
ncbi:hypothetical protein JCM13664_07280 [Methylothermus subterraneus]